MAELDRDRVLALSYVPADRRTSLEALWRLDAVLGSTLAGGREPLISRIKLAWWRDELEDLKAGERASEPVLQAVAQHVRPAGVSGGELAAMEEGWAVLLSPDPLTEAELGDYAAARGGTLFRLSSRLLGRLDEEVAAAGEAWALIDLARHCASTTDQEAAVAAARARLAPRRWPSRLRPLTMLAALAARDSDAKRPRWEEQGAPGRMLRMLRLRITGY